MWKVLLGPYYWKHRIYTRDQIDDIVSRKLESVNLYVCILIVYVLCFNIVMTRYRAGGSGSGSGSGTGTEPVDEG